MLYPRCARSHFGSTCSKLPWFVQCELATARTDIGMADELAGTPASGPSLTPPSPRLGAASGGDLDVDLDIGSGILPDPNLSGDAPVPAPGTPDQLDDVMFSLTLAGNAAERRPRRGPRRRGLAILDRYRAERGQDDGMDAPMEAIVDAGDDEVPRLAIEDEGAGPLVDYPGQLALARIDTEFAREEFGVQTLVVDGYAHLSDLPLAVVSQAQFLAENPETMDSRTFEFLGKCIRSSKLQPLGAEAADAELDPRTTRKAKHRWAASFWMQVLLMRSNVERTLASPIYCKALVYDFEWARYDETPLPVRTQERFHAMIEDDPNPGKAVSLLGLQGMRNKLDLKSTGNAKTYCNRRWLTDLSCDLARR